MQKRRTDEVMWMQFSCHAQYGGEFKNKTKFSIVTFHEWQEKNHCEINGLVCLNEHYEDLSIVIAAWSKARKRKGIVCNCMPSCNEVDILVIHETRDNIFNPHIDPYSVVEVSLANLPTERYKRNVVRGKLDLVGKSQTFKLTKFILKFNNHSSVDRWLHRPFHRRLSPFLC